VSGDCTASNQLTAGIAEIPVGADIPERGHTHDAAEIYYFISGAGFFARDAFSDVHYEFPGAM